MSVIERALLKQKSKRDTISPERTEARSATSSLGAGDPAFSSRGVLEPFTDDELETAGLLASPEFRTRHRSQYRGIRRVLLDRMKSNDAADGVRSRALTVTSALAGDGKTFSAFNLALSLSQDPQYQVLLIDADLPRRTLSERLGKKDVPGFSECLLEGDSLPENNAWRLRERFHFLPAGLRFVDAGDRLATSAFPEMLDSLLQQYRSLVIVLDAGPLLLSAEAEVVSSRAGAVLLVARAGVTPRNAARDALARVPKDVPVGVMLNGWGAGAFGDPEHYLSQYYDYTK